MIVVTGATGNVGRPLVEALAGANHAVTAVSRGATAALPTQSGVIPVAADLSDATSLEPALMGADALFVLVSGAGAHVDGPEVMQRAHNAGVRHVVLLSSQAVATRPESVAYAPLAALEEAVRASGMSWTILRAAGFATNAFAWIPSIREQLAVFAPFGDVALPAVDPHDIAEMATVTLIDEAHAGQTYVLTGPESTSPRNRTEILGRVLGESLNFVEQSYAEARAQLVQFMPEPVADGTLAILGQPTAEERRVSPDIQHVLGRPARSFTEWAEQNADAFS